MQQGNDEQQLQQIESYLNLDQNYDQFSSFLQCQIDNNIYGNLPHENSHPQKSESQLKLNKKLTNINNIQLQQKTELENEINMLYKKYPDLQQKQEHQIDSQQPSINQQNDFPIEELVKFEIHLDLQENNNSLSKTNSPQFLLALPQPSQLVDNDEIAIKSNNQIEENNQLELPIYQDFPDMLNNVCSVQLNILDESAENLQNFNQNQNSEIIVHSENQEANVFELIRADPFIIIKNYAFKRKAKAIENKKDGETKQKQKRGPYKKYTVEQKKEIIKQATDEENIKCLSKLVAIDAKTIKRWKEKGAYRQKGGGRKVQVNCIQELLKKLAKERSNVEDFKASKGWYAKFNARFKFDEYQEKYLAQFQN